MTKKPNLIELEKTLRFVKLIKEGDKVNADDILALSSELTSLKEKLVVDEETRGTLDVKTAKALEDLNEDVGIVISLIDELAEGSLTESDVEAIVARLEKPLPILKDGYTPIKGVDYFDGENGKDADEEAILERVLARISIPEVQEVLNGEQIIELINDSEGKIDRDRVEGLSELEERVSKIKGGFTMFGGSASSEEILGKTFETISKNLNSNPYTISYTGDNISSISYTTPRGVILKTLSYTGDNLTSIVLSGAIQVGGTLTKTLAYSGDNLSSVSYA